MSFNINWPEFSQEFIDSAKQQLTVALNNGSKPANIAPDLEILEISELLQDRFKGIFKLVYNGDAHIILKTKVQANPLTTAPRVRSVNLRQGMLAAQRPLVVPMQIRISNFKLRGIIVLVVDQEKGITLVFKNDPLDKVDVNSTFDNTPNIRRFLQTQIEGQLRNLFQDDLPQMIHNLSLVMLNKKGTGTGGVAPGSNLASSASHPVLAGSVGGGGGGGRNNSARFSEDSISSPRPTQAYPELEHQRSTPLANVGKFSYEGSYSTDESRWYASQRRGSNTEGHIPHNQKWSGNDPVDTIDGYTSDYDTSNGYVLYRSLSQFGASENDIGLNHAFLDGQYSQMQAEKQQKQKQKQKQQDRLRKARAATADLGSETQSQASGSQSISRLSARSGTAGSLQ
eukprot:jgi/Hompol1/5009/HPOL_000671-RA